MKVHSLFFPLSILVTMLVFTGCNVGVIDDANVTTSQSQEDGGSVSTSEQSPALTSYTESAFSTELVETIPADGFNAILVGAPVQGVTYECGGESGVTDSDGMFHCNALPVSFKVGSILLGSIDTIHADYAVYPQDIVGVTRAATTHPEVTKIAVLLQSLDSDGINLNGVQIAPETLLALSSIFTANTSITEITLSNLDIALNELVQLLQNSNADSQLVVVSAETAQDNLSEVVANPPESPSQPN